MAESFRVRVEPGVMSWLRELAGWDVEDVARRIGTSARAVSDMEAGRREPTVRQIGAMSAAFRLPSGAFLLPRPQEGDPLPEDRRRRPARPGAFGRHVAYAIRRSRYMQQLGAEMMSGLGIDPRPRVRRARLGDDPAAAAAAYRGRFGLGWDAQRRMRGAGQLLAYLRDRMEAESVLTFQFPMPPGDAGDSRFPTRGPP